MKAPSDHKADAEARQWLKQIAAGDERAFNCFASHYRPRVLRFVQRRLPDPGAAEEVVQDVMLAVWRQADRYLGRGRVSTWLLGIAHNKAISATRKRRPDPVGTIPDSVDDPAARPEHLAVQAADARRLGGALRELSDLHRETLRLVFFEHLSLSEVAAAMNCPVGTVKSRLAYARKHLARLLAGPDAGEPHYPAKGGRHRD